MFTAQTSRATGTTSGPMGPDPSMLLSRSLALHMATRTRLPLAARASASAAQTVVLPTPPLPVTRTKRLSAGVHICSPPLFREEIARHAHAKEMPLRIVVLGGLGEGGMNCLALEQGG